MKKFLMFILCTLFSINVSAKKEKITKTTEIKKMKNFKPLLREEKAREILEMNKDDGSEENYNIKNKKYLVDEYADGKKEEREVIDLREDKSKSDDLDEVEDDEDENEKDLKNNIKILTANYKYILDLSSSCCVGNIAEKMRIHNLNRNNKTQNIVDLLTIDANTYYVQNTCLLLSDIAINNIVKNKDLNKIFKETRKDCICNNQELLFKNIKNFQKLYETDKNFYKTKFIYKSKDDQGRIIEQDMNETVLNILSTLDTCMK